MFVNQVNNIFFIIIKLTRLLTPKKPIHFIKIAVFNNINSI